ncbi:MAG: phosphoenolpyruvate synthase regulatory protein [Rickettsiales bacterium]|nr:phosphoenolpyruvate synthase regulatory protein [Rickettsiales bacterium]
MNSKNNIHIHIISDSTGETVSTVSRSAIAHFKNFNPIEHSWVLVRSEKQLLKIIEEIKINKGLVIYTLIDKKLRKILEDNCNQISVPIIAVLDPVVNAIEHYFNFDLAIDKPGRQHSLSIGYFDRIGAMQYTLAHDDGQLSNDLEEAEIILVGVSRTSKTPTSMYLANRGIRVANIPIVPGLSLPNNLLETTVLVIGLTTSPERLALIRKSRLNSVGEKKYTNYIQEDLIEQEVIAAKKLFLKNKWPIIDVTRKSIEETAAAAMDYLRQYKERIALEK